MTQGGWSVDLNDENPDPRVACVVLADVSGSMRGAPIAALERGFASFTHYFNNDPLASKRVEVAVVTFGSVATVQVPMQEARGLQPARFTASGRTNMAAGIHLALDIIEDRKSTYKAAGLQYTGHGSCCSPTVRRTLRVSMRVARLNAAEMARG